MKNLKLKCPSCNRLFRTENGLIWHLLNIHQLRDAYAIVKDQLARSKAVARWTVGTGDAGKYMPVKATDGEYETFDRALSECIKLGLEWSRLETEKWRLQLQVVDVVLDLARQKKAA